LTGSFLGTAIFGAGEPNETTLTAEGPSDWPEDAWVAVFHEDGTLKWATSFGGAFDQPPNTSGFGWGDIGYGVAFSPNGDYFYASGEFQTRARFGKDEPNETWLDADPDAWENRGAYLVRLQP